MESFRKTITIPTGVASDKLGKSEIFNKQFEKASNAIRDAASELLQGNKSYGDVFKELGDKFGDQGEDVKSTLQSLATQVFNDLKDKNLGYKSGEIGKMSNAALEGLRDIVKPKSETPKSGVTTATAKAASAKSNASTLYGVESLAKSSNPNQTLTSAVNATNSTSKDDVTFTLKIDAPPGVSSQYLDQLFKTENFKEMIYSYVQQKNKQLEKTT